MVKPYGPGDRPALEELLAPLPDGGALLDWALARPDCLLLDWDGGRLRAAAPCPMQPGAQGCLFSLYVAPAFRRQGIGAALLAAVRAWAKGRGAVRLQCETPEHRAGLAGFLAGHGLSPWFTTRDMRYCGPPLPEPELRFSSYEDRYYPDYVDLQAQAFFELRRANDCQPYWLRPSDAERSRLAARPEQTYLCWEAGALAGACSVMEGYLDNLAVSRAHRGRGLGRALVTHGVNVALAGGAGSAALTVLDWNQDAIRLYEKLGFVTVQHNTLYRMPL